MVTEDLMVDAYFPKGIIVEILLRLPVKSLLRFKVVCKSWCYLISSSNFTNTYLSLSTKTGKCLHQMLLLSNLSSNPPFLNSFSLASTLYSPSVRPSQLDYSFFDPNKSEIVGTFNGLLCLVTSNPRNVILWNPSTREFKALPSSRTCLRRWSRVMYGFGYNKSVDDYKVVEISFASRFCEDQKNVKVYSLRTNSWKTIGELRKGIITYSSNSQCVNGTLYWFVNYQDSSGFSRVVILFNMETETFGMLEFPNVDVAYHGCWRLVVLNGYLSAFCENDKDRTDVWIMNEDGAQECWTKLVSMANNGGNEDLIPLSILENDQMLVYCSNWISIYNMKNGKFKKLWMHNSYGATVDIYVESFISPCFDNGGSQSNRRKRNREFFERGGPAKV